MEIQHAQDILTIWKKSVMPSSELTPQKEGERSFEEIEEYRGAFEKYDGTDKTAFDLAEEATDVVIRMFGVIGSLGFSVEAMIDNKLQVIYDKYSPEKVRMLNDMGMESGQAMKFCKNAWNHKNV